MNFFFSLVKRESSSDARNSSAASRANRAARRSRMQANNLMDRMGRMEDRG